jgi:hypothetical protein
MELKKLASIANKLDSLGLTKEADIIDNFIKKVAAARKIVRGITIGEFIEKVNNELRKLRGKPEELANIRYKVGLIKQSGSYDETASYGSTPILNLYISYYLMSPSLPFDYIMYEDEAIQKKLEMEIDKYRGAGVARTAPGAGKGGGKGSGGSSRAGGGTVAGGTGAGGKGAGGTGGGGTGSGGPGGVDSWARYIATAKDPKTGRVDTELNTRVKQIWQSTRPADKEFSGFTSWYRQTKDNMSAYDMTPKDFGQEQAIALVQITGGSAKDWQRSDQSMRSVYENIIGQDPASFDPSSVGLSRSGVGYSADIKGYKPTTGRTSAPAQALLRSQMKIPSEQDYAGKKDTFEDDSEIEFTPEAKRQMARQMAARPQAMSGASTKLNLDYRTNQLAGGTQRTELRDYTDEDGDYIDEFGRKI